MAQRMNTYQPAYAPDELKMNLLQQSFADKKHNAYVLYDEVEDQLVIRLVEPSVFASEYFIDDLALLVKEDKTVVGVVIPDYQSDFLPKVPKLKSLWYEYKMAAHFSHFQKLEYKPDYLRNEKPAQRAELKIVQYSGLAGRQASVLVPA